MTTRWFIHHHHRHQHRHRKFHVRPEAKGIGYRRFLGVPSCGAHRAAESEANAEKSQEATADEWWWWLVVGVGIVVGIVLA